MIPVLAALAIAALPAGSRAGIGIHVAATERLAPDQVSAIGALLREMTQSWTGEDRVLIDDLIWEEGHRSADDVRTRLGVRDVLILELEDAGPRIRIVAELFIGRSSRGLIVEMPRERDAWEDGLRPIVQDFFTPKPRAETKPALGAIARAPDEPWSPLPWVAIAAGAVFATAGIAMAISAADARDRLENTSLTPAAAHELDGSRADRNLAGVLFISAAIASAGAGLTWWVLD